MTDMEWPTDAVSSVSNELDLDAWIDGTCGLTRTARIFQRGDLITKIEQLEKERDVAIEVAKTLPKGERNANDRGPEQIQQEIDELSVQAAESALIMHVQDRTEERRNGIRERLLKAMKVSDEDKLSFENTETINLHIIADAIIKVETPDGKTKDLPEGFPPNKLRELVQRLGDAALGDLWMAFRRVTMEAPHVSAPLSRRNSSGPGGIT